MTALDPVQHGLTTASRAVASIRQLVPSEGVNEAAVASVLTTRSNRLSNAGLHDEAVGASEEAVAALRRLVAAEPGAHEAELALSLNTLSICLAAAGHCGEGLAASGEAVGIGRQLSAKEWCTA